MNRQRMQLLTAVSLSVVILGAVASGALLFGIAFGGCTFDSPQAPQEKLQVSVRGSALIIQVTNDESQDLRDVSVMVNEKYFCEKAPMLGRHENRDFVLAGCASLGGERFNPVTMAPVNVYVSAFLDRDQKKAGNGFQFNR